MHVDERNHVRSKALKSGSRRCKIQWRPFAPPAAVGVTVSLDGFIADPNDQVDELLRVV